MSEAAKNTDRELWREIEGDYYSPSIHLTEGGGIGINVGGHVIVKSLRDWHALANPPGDLEKGIPVVHTGGSKEVLWSGFVDPLSFKDPGIPVYKLHDATDDVLGKDGE